MLRLVNIIFICVVVSRLRLYAMNQYQNRTGFNCKGFVTAHATQVTSLPSKSTTMTLFVSAWMLLSRQTCCCLHCTIGVETMIKVMLWYFLYLYRRLTLFLCVSLHELPKHNYLLNDQTTKLNYNNNCNQSNSPKQTSKQIHPQQYCIFLKINGHCRHCTNPHGCSCKSFYRFTYVHIMVWKGLEWCSKVTRGECK